MNGSKIHHVVLQKGAERVSRRLLQLRSAERNDRNALAVDHRCPECKGDHFLPADEGAGITTIKVKCTECGQKFHILLWRRQIIYVERIS